MESSGTQRQVNADFFTASYRVVGKVMIPSSGLIGLLNDTLSASVDIVDAHLARAHMPTKLVGSYEITRLVKHQIVAVCLARREDMGPAAVVRGGFTNLQQYPCLLTTADYELTGTLEMPGRFDFSAMVVEGARDFSPAYDVTLTGILVPSLKVESPAVLFNKRHIHMAALQGQKRES